MFAVPFAFSGSLVKALKTRVPASNPPVIGFASVNPRDPIVAKFRQFGWE